VLHDAIVHLRAQEISTGIHVCVSVWELLQRSARNMPANGTNSL